MNQKYLLLLLFTFINISIQAQTITGKVVNDNDLPVENAIILLNESQASFTDAEGKFSFLNLEPGNYVLTTNLIGFESRTDSVVLKNQDLTLDLVLAADPLELQSIVVTGTYQADKKMNTAVAISSLSNTAINKRGAYGTADLLKSIPGTFVDASAGEVYTRIYNRGLSTSVEDDLGWYYMSLQEEGLPVSLVQYSFFSPDLFYRTDLTTSRLEAIRGGSAAITSNNAPGGIFNFISKIGTPISSNEIEVASALQGDNNMLYRLDGNFGGALSKKGLFYNVGGFYRYDEGPRNTDYPWSKGGQLKANISKRFGSGHLKFYAKYLNDHTNRYIGLAAENWNDPKPAFGQDFNNTALMLPEVVGEIPDTRRTSEPNSTRTYDSSNGIHTKDFTIGFDLANRFSSGWIFENKLKYSNKSADWQSTISSQRLGLENFLSYFLSGDGFPFGQVVFHDAQTNEELARVNNFGALGPLSGEPPSFEYLTDGTLPNDAILGTAPWQKLDEATDLMYKLNLKKEWNQHFFNIGLFAGQSSVKSFTQGSFAYATYENEPRMLRVTLENPGSSVVNLSDQNGLASYGGLFYNNANADVAQVQLSFADDIKVNDRLNIDAGISWEYINHTGLKDRSGSQTQEGGLDGDLTTAYDQLTILPELMQDSFDFDYNYFNFSLGANYKINSSTAGFARFTRSNKAPELNYYFSNFANIPIDQKGKVQEITQAELGVKVQKKAFNLFATAFWSQLDNVSFIEFVFDQDGTGGLFFTPEQLNKTTSFGLELEAAVQPVNNFELRMIATLQDASATSFTIYDAGGTFDRTDDRILDYSGNDLPHQPKLTLEVIPSYRFSKFEIFGAWRYVGSREANVANAFQLPGFSTFRAGISANLMRNLSVQLVGTNLSNSTGLMYSFGPNEFGSSSNAATPEYVANNPDQTFIVMPILTRRILLKVKYGF